MSQAQVFTPLNPLRECVRSEAGAPAQQLVRQADRRVQDLTDAIRLDVIGKLDRLFAITDQADAEVLAQAKALGDLALSICEVAATEDLAPIGAVARGVKIMIDDMDRRGAWRVDALKLHADGLKILKSSVGLPKEAVQAILGDLRMVREKVARTS